MNRKYLWSAAAGCALLVAMPISAADRAPSLHVQCDGNPDNVSPGETAARLLGAVTLLGLFAPTPEAPNASARLYGREGILACNQIVAGEKSDLRRAQLLLANAIHHIEAGDYAGARQQLRTLATERPHFSQTQSYRLTLGVSAAEVEALVLLHEGKTDEAARLMLAAAAAVPYDMVTQMNASRFAMMTGRFGDAEKRYYDDLVRIYPLAMMTRVDARQMAGDFAGAAADTEAMIALWNSYAKKRAPSLHGHLAISRALAGDHAGAATAAKQARADMERDAAENEAAIAGELLDLYNILVMHKEGRAREARLLFAARSNWTRPSAGAVARVAQILREGAPQDELIGTLAGDPDQFRRNRIAKAVRQARLTGFEGENDEAEPEGDLGASAAAKSSDKSTEARRRSDRAFQMLRTYWTDKQFAAFSKGVWRADKAHYLAKDPSEELRARFISTQRDGYGTPGGYALLLHAALKAEAEGKTAFMLLPGQRSMGLHFVRIGNPGDEGMVGPFTYNAADVIRDLAPVIPKPAPRR